MVFSPSECWNREKIQNRRDREGEAPAEPHGPRTCQDSGSPSQFLTAPPTFVHPYTALPHCPISIEPIPCFDYNSCIHMVFTKEGLCTDPGWLV